MRVLLGTVEGQITPEKDEDREGLITTMPPSYLLGVQHLSRKFLDLHSYTHVYHA